MVVGEASIHNIMGGMESTGGVRLHNHKRKLKQRFDIIKKLGQGTYGKVQLGINKETGQEVAIKTIKKCKIETEADLIRIRREIQIMSSVQHPNIIHIYEVFENKEKMVLVMEYAAGGELYDYLSERKVLSEQEARRIFRQISIAVFYCHKHKICHRDLKLENILLDQIGNAKIADFGLSNVFDEQRLLNTFCGSPLYASPEIVKGTPYHGPEVDCWSLGVLLYTLVYGAMPFDGSNFKRLTRQISQSDYFEPKNPSPASPLIKDMLTKCPARRSDIEKICSHWWVNEGYEQNCLDIAEDLAAQTPVRLDLLLSLVPQSASADKLVVGDQRPTGEVVTDMSSETLVPTRCHSVGSLMELDRNNSDRRVREMVEEEPRGASATGDSKRKLENTPSMDETAGLEAGAKRKERMRKKDKNDETRPHRFTSNRHHSAPIAHPITEEAMEVDPSVMDNVSAKPLLDLRNDETASACLELIKESLSKSPSKERSKTPVAIPDKPSPMACENVQDVNENVNDVKPLGNKLAGVQDKSPEPSKRKVPEEGANKVKNEITSKKEAEIEEKIMNAPAQVPNKEENHELEKGQNEKVPIPQENESAESPNVKDVKKLKQKALSLDSEVSNEAAVPPSKPTERRRSKIFETAEKFNQLAAGVESEKPKKIFIPGVNVGGAKRAFERKASLSSIVPPQTVKQSASKVIIDVPNDTKNEKLEDKPNTVMKTSQEVKDESLKREEEKKRAVDIITGALGKPPVQKKLNGSPPITPQSPESKKLGLKIQVGPNDVRSATVSVSTPVDTKFPFETKPVPYEISVPNSPESQSFDSSYTDEPTVSSKMEITLKSATLPRQRKTSKAEITLSGIKSPESGAFKSEVEAKIDAFHPQKLRTQRSEVAFPVAAVVPQANRSSSLEPESAAKMVPKERIIPIQVEADHQQQRQTSTPPPKPPMPQRSMSQRSNSLSRQSTADSDTDSALGSTIGPEPIRKSPREYIIPIAVEGGGYVTPRSGSVEPESKNSTPTSINPPRSRFGRPRRMSSLLSDASEDESPFSTLHRDSDDLLQRHMHRLRSSRPTRQPPEHADSLSSGEDDDDDGFELLTAENLFSTLLSRVRSLTQRLNVDDNRGSGFPSSRLLGRLGSNSSQGFWGLHEPLSSYESYFETQTITTRLSESPFRRSMSRDTDCFGKRDSAVPSNSGTPSSPGTRSTPSRESIFEMGSSNTLPRDRKTREETESEDSATEKLRKCTKDSLEHNFTPSLARRLSRQFIEQTRQSLPRSPSIPREKLFRSSTDERAKENGPYGAAVSDQTEYRSRSCDRGVRRTNSLLESSVDRFEQRSPRRSVSLFDDEDEEEDGSLLVSGSLPRQVMTLGRKYRDPSKSGLGSFHSYRTDKIQEEPHDEFSHTPNNQSPDELKEGARYDGSSRNNSRTNLLAENGSSLSARSCETSPTESSSTLGDSALSTYKQDSSSRDFESRLLAAENLIKESKARNLGAGKYDRNLSSSYKDTDKCDKELLGSIVDVSNNYAKRRSCIPSLRLRSGSLTREAPSTSERRNTVSCAKDSSHSATPERSILSKFFRAGSTNGGSAARSEDSKEKSPKCKEPRRISRFLRPDFFDTPREESQYVKDKEAQKAAENERRKCRFTRKKPETKPNSGDEMNNEEEKKPIEDEERPEKELKNEANAMTRDKSDVSSSDNKFDTENPSLSTSEPKTERQASKSSSFLQSLEKKLDKFRSSDDSAKLVNGNGPTKERAAREKSAPPVETSEDSSKPSKRPTSVEDLTLPEPSAGASKSRVSSVLGLFKNDSTKLGSNGQRAQSTILSKFKKNPYKGSRSDGVLSGDQSPSTSNGSKIPTKFAKLEAKTKKPGDSKKSPEKTLEPKKSPSKEKSPPPQRSASRKSLEKQLKVTKKTSPEKTVEGKQDKPEKSTSSKDELSRKNGSPEKSENKIMSIARLSGRKTSTEKITDNKQIEAKSNESEDKKLIVKAKKNVKSLTSLVKNGSVSKLEGRDKLEGLEKKVKKVVKPKETADKDAPDGTRKKKVVRVVKKTSKSSDSSDSKSEEKEPTKKTLMKKLTSVTKKEASPEKSSKKIKDKSPESSVKKMEEKSPEKAVNSGKEKSPEKQCGVTEDAIPETRASSSPAKNPEPKVAAESPAIPRQETPRRSPKGELPLSPEAVAPSSDSSAPKQPDAANADADSKSCLPGLGTAKSNKVNLKLDLTKIPQHSFKVGALPKKDSPKAESTNFGTIVAKSPASESPKSVQVEAKLMENLSKTSHHASTTGGKIAIDKPLRAKDFETSRKEATSPEPPKNSETPCALGNGPGNGKDPQEVRVEGKDSLPKPSTPLVRPTTLPLDSKSADASSSPRETASDHTEDMFSPVDDAESFDSWSICSADLNHHRHDLNSPTSPTYSPLSRGEHPESIIDRIRRKSFYSRFNERKRKSSLNAAPPGVALPSPSSLPRKYSFTSSRDKQEYRKPRIYGASSRRNPERSYSLYNEETLPSYRKSSLERERHYSDSVANGASSCADSKSPNEQYSSLSSCYDPLRRYRVTPSPDPLNSHRKYQSTEYGLDDDGGSYKSPMSPTFHDNNLDPYAPRSSLLPRKYGSVSSCPESKTAEYYEELLTPSRSDYLTSRKTPVPNDFHSRHENGYHNGTLDPHQATSDKWKNYSDKIDPLDLTDGNDRRLDKSIRSNVEGNNESPDLPTPSTESEVKVSKVE
ncbi:serine/arginine repetitive matrix protein 2 isoform X2 [Venturia canescens]|uniref:serine/arginine repetitive matrix protein 2 isoform X2 n=1 Tax=Venturia canescens TaxID=32260 RepID=UPI001C9CF078|nr:serine/arginine repetitive matrix protein 2 isoform X2 [Venturia canescens]